MNVGLVIGSRAREALKGQCGVYNSTGGAGLAIGVVGAGVGFPNGACFARGLGGVVGVFSRGARFALVGGESGFVGKLASGAIRALVLSKSARGRHGLLSSGASLTPDAGVLMVAAVVNGLSRTQRERDLAARAL